MTNEMPKEAGGWWACRLKPEIRPSQFTNTSIGKIFRYEDILLFIGHWSGGEDSFQCNEFQKYDWHKIELPEGWR